MSILLMCSPLYQHKGGEITHHFACVALNKWEGADSPPLASFTLLGDAGTLIQPLLPSHPTAALPTSSLAPPLTVTLCYQDLRVKQGLN